MANASKNFYITTTLPYVNADPHIGFALEVVEADILARYHVLRGDAVFFNTGTDEHGIKIYRKAQEAGKNPQEYVDGYAEKFRNLQKILNLWEGLNFIRTTDERHEKAAQEFWKLCDKNGDIYKKNYKIKYCVGCELEKTDSELNEKRCCPLHPDQELEIINEENYFFRFSKYEKPLLDFYEKNPRFVVPESRFREIKAFAEWGLEDFSISRLKEKMPWGISVPGDDTQVMYVWFDALVNYISAIGWPRDMEKFNTWWPVLQLAGKDQIRQQAAMWTAMLMSAGLPQSKQIVIHGFITSGGQKMSKSLGNVINPVSIVNEYGTDALRYYLARHIHPFEDSDFTMGKFKEAYNASLANGLGNLVSRVMKLAEENLESPIEPPVLTPFPKEYTNAIESYEFNRAMDYIWSRVQKLDERITGEKPFALVKANPTEGKRVIAELVEELYWIGRMLFPFIPETSVKIKETIKQNKKPKNLFPRKE